MNYAAVIAVTVLVGYAIATSISTLLATVQLGHFIP